MSTINKLTGDLYGEGGEVEADFDNPLHQLALELARDEKHLRQTIATKAETIRFDMEALVRTMSAPTLTGRVANSCGELQGVNGLEIAVGSYGRLRETIGQVTYVLKATADAAKVEA